jgi:hypothetical protein
VAILVIFSTGSLYPFGLDRVYAWASEVGYDGVEIMRTIAGTPTRMPVPEPPGERARHPILALHTPLHRGAWGLELGETLVRSAKWPKALQSASSA